jgi:hypothetical protein
MRDLACAWVLCMFHLFFFAKPTAFLFLFLGFFFLAILGLMLVKQVLYHLSHTLSPSLAVL